MFEVVYIFFCDVFDDDDDDSIYKMQLRNIQFKLDLCALTG